MYSQIYKYTNTLTCLPLTCLDLQMEAIPRATVKGILQCRHFRNNEQPHWPPTLKLTWPSLDLHYQGQQTQLATLEGPQIPHLGQWAVVLRCPTNAKLHSGEVQMSKCREKTLTDKCTRKRSCTHTAAYMYIHFTNTPINNSANFASLSTHTLILS